MNLEDITINEQYNDGTAIYFYKSSKIGTWTAYDKSAFAVYCMAIRDDFLHLVSFSDRLKMPAITVDESTYNAFTKILESRSNNEQGFHFLNPMKWNEKEYNLWLVDILSVDRIFPEQTIDDLVPDHRFIKDHMSIFEHEIKRIIDLIISIIVMIVFSPLFLITYIAVRLEDRGPAIYKQERIGRFGRPFYIYKFRSMRMDAEKFGPALSHAGGENDPRLTKVGKFIRAHHLDELPQLWNVFVGHMSFVATDPKGNSL